MIIKKIQRDARGGKTTYCQIYAGYYQRIFPDYKILWIGLSVCNLHDAEYMLRRNRIRIDTCLPIPKYLKGKQYNIIIIDNADMLPNLSKILLCCLRCDHLVLTYTDQSRFEKYWHGRL